MAGGMCWGGILAVTLVAFYHFHAAGKYWWTANTTPDLGRTLDENPIEKVINGRETAYCSPKVILPNPHHKSSSSSLSLPDRSIKWDASKNQTSPVFARRKSEVGSRGDECSVCTSVEISGAFSELSLIPWDLCGWLERGNCLEWLLGQVPWGWSCVLE